MNKNEYTSAQGEGENVNLDSFWNDIGKEILIKQMYDEDKWKMSKSVFQKKGFPTTCSDSNFLNTLTYGTANDKVYLVDPEEDANGNILISKINKTKSLNIPLHIFEKEGECEGPKNNYFELLHQEVIHLKEKFELNNRSFQLDDLLRLTENSKKILDFQISQKYPEYDRKIEDSVFYNLEYKKMVLERRVGFHKFLKSYSKMFDIINNDFNLSLISSLETQNDNALPSHLGKVSGDSDDVIKNAWKSIINSLGDKQEELPDIWELAMSENIYYHL